MNPVAVPLYVVCLAIVVLIPFLAARSKLHIPGYVGLAFLAFFLAMIAGHFSGAPNVIGKTPGLVLAIVFFLLVATAVGCIVALFFYRHPPEV
jgi:hypothetical protein